MRGREKRRASDRWERNDWWEWCWRRPTRCLLQFWTAILDAPISSGTTAGRARLR